MNYSLRLSCEMPLFAALLLLCASAQAATITVTTNADAGAGSLRQAVADAAADDTINFAPDANAIVLTSGQIELTKSVTIAGNGARTTSISGNNKSRIFVLQTAGIYTISDVTLTAGNGAGGSSRYGGAVRVDGTGATLNLLRVWVNRNTALGGGGVQFTKGIALNVSECLFSNNTATFAGGGIQQEKGTFNLRNSTLSGNTANSTANGGGGIRLILNSTANIVSSTITGNTAVSNGGGISYDGETAQLGETVNLSNSIVAGNRDTSSSAPDLSGPITSQGYNLIGNLGTTTFTATTGDQVGTASTPINAKLGALVNNQGPTDTYALQVDSPAIDKGATDLITDQRGIRRPQGNADDIGAFELQVPLFVSDISVSTNEDTAFTFAATSFDSGFTDPNDKALQSVRIESLPANGTLRFDGIAATLGQTIARADLTKLTFTPALNFNGQTGFGFNASNGTLFAAKSARLTINVTPVNDAPQNSVMGAQTTNEDTALTLNGRTQWSTSGMSVDDVDNATLTLTLSVEHGALTLSQTTNLTFTTGDGTADATMTFSGAKADLNNALRSLNYAPTANFNGADTLTLTSSDSALSDTDTVAITVTAVNDAPVAAAQNVTTNEDTSKAITLSASDVDNANLTYRVTSGPANGTLSGTAPNLTYTPNANFNGADSFTFVANDGTVDSAPTTIAITVTAVNDAPVAAAQNVTTDEDISKVITLSATDVDNANLTYRVTSGPANGTLSGTAPNLTYTPNKDFSGADSFTFVANDGTVDSAPATVSIIVNAVNDSLIANAQSVTTNEDISKVITLSATTLNKNALTYRVVSGPTNGTLTGTAPNLTYAPNANFNGADSFTFVANDGTVDSAPATVSITINAVNDAPSFTVGSNQIVSEDAGSQLVTGFATGISAGAPDESAQTLAFDVINDNNTLFAVQPSINVAGDLSYRAKDNATGTANIKVKLQDNGGVLNGGQNTSGTRGFSISVTAVNDAPIALADAYLTDQNTTLTVNAANGVLKNDSDIDSTNLSAVLDQTVSRGTLTLNSDGSFTFVPERNFRGITAFSYHVSDGQLKSKTVDVTLGVNATTQPINFGVSIVPKSPATNDVLTATPVILESEANGTSYSYAWSVGNVVKQNGASNSFDLSIAGNGDKGQRVSVVVTATRGIDGGSATNFVDVRNSAPFAFSQSGAANAGVPTQFTLRGADLDAEVLTYKSVGGPSNGTATIVNNADGTATLTYTARRDFGGVETIRFVSLDESGRPSTPTMLSINVTPQAPAPLPNRAPSANNVTASTHSGVSVKVALSGSDPDGDALTFKRVGGPSNGTGEIARDSDGIFKMFYTPRAGFVGNEIIRFVALDTTGKPSAVATITINVTGINTPSAGNS